MAVDHLLNRHPPRDAIDADCSQAFMGLGRPLARSGVCQGGYCVVQAYGALFGGASDPSCGRQIRVAEWHLWASGAAVIALGIALAGGLSYLHNPKLWTKLVVVAVWWGSSMMLGALRPMPPSPSKRTTMLLICSISGACWLYGAFLGVAKTLANGTVPFGGFMLGFAITILACMAATFWMEKRRLQASQTPLDWL
jgi:hypothetical protein